MKRYHRRDAAIKYSSGVSQYAAGAVVPLAKPRPPRVGARKRERALPFVIWLSRFEFVISIKLARGAGGRGRERDRIVDDPHGSTHPRCSLASFKGLLAARYSVGIGIHHCETCEEVPEINRCRQ